jgi:thiol-disulfide isomerase/thioredoxin
MKRRVFSLLTCGMMLLAFKAAAVEFRPFDDNSLMALKQEQAGRPFVLVLWSASCVPCREELRLWGEWSRRYPTVKVVLVSTDPPEEHAAAQRMAERYADPHADLRAFASDYAEHLRWSIDPAWHGEVPRSYFFDAAHHAEPKSGLVDAAFVEGWLSKNSPIAKGTR